MRKSEDIKTKLKQVHHDEDPRNSPSGFVMHNNSQSAENRFELLLQTNLAILELLEKQVGPTTA